MYRTWVNNELAYCLCLPECGEGEHRNPETAFCETCPEGEEWNGQECAVPSVACCSEGQCTEVPPSECTGSLQGVSSCDGVTCGQCTEPSFTCSDSSEPGGFECCGEGTSCCFRGGYNQNICCPTDTNTCVGATCGCKPNFDEDGNPLVFEECELSDGGFLCINTAD